MTASSDLRSRIDGYCVRSASYYYGEWTVSASFDGIDVEHSIDGVDRDEVVDVALAGLRIDWVRREIERGTATAADIRVALEGAPALALEEEEVSDLQEAFMLLASDGELDAWRSEKIRRLADEMDEAEAAHRANPRPILVDAETVHVWSLDPAVIGTTVVVSTAPDADSFDVVVADCLPDDDDGDEEPGAMFKRALGKAEAIDDHHRQITEWALKEVVGGVRGFGVERGADGLWHVLMRDGSKAFSILEGDLPDQPGAARKVVSALYSAWLDGVRGERARSAAKGAAS